MIVRSKFLASLAVLLISCTSRQTAFSLEEIEEIHLKVDAPFSVAELVVQNNTEGQPFISYEAHSDETLYVDKDSKFISSEDFEELKIRVTDPSFNSLEEIYFSDALLDGTRYTVQVDYDDGHSYSVQCYGTCPDEAVEIRNFIGSYGQESDGNWLLIM